MKRKGREYIAHVTGPAGANGETGGLQYHIVGDEFNGMVWATPSGASDHLTNGSGSGWAHWTIVDGAEAPDKHRANVDIARASRAGSKPKSDTPKEKREPKEKDPTAPAGRHRQNIRKSRDQSGIPEDEVRWDCGHCAATEGMNPSFVLAAGTTPTACPNGHPRLEAVVETPKAPAEPKTRTRKPATDKPATEAPKKPAAPRKTAAVKNLKKLAKMKGDQSDAHPGEDQWHCTACQAGFWVTAGTTPTLCPQGHPARFADGLDAGMPTADDSDKVTAAPASDDLPALDIE